jgi:hypothetical protein
MLHYGKGEIQCLGCIASRRVTVGGVAAGRYDSRVPIRVRDVWFVGVHGPFESDYTGWPPPDQVRFKAPAGFREVTPRRFQNFVLRHFVTAQATPLSVPRLLSSVTVPPPAVSNSEQTRVRVLERD